jgi:hypothetical protein
MNKEFIPYEQALELKQLGFDETCFFAFDNCSTPMRCTDLRTNEQKFYGVNYNSSTYTSQPTFSQAFKWFREKYNLSHLSLLVMHIFESEKPYEEAELACLNELIKIVKNK